MGILGEHPIPMECPKKIGHWYVSSHTHLWLTLSLGLRISLQVPLLWVWPRWSWSLPYRMFSQSPVARRVLMSSWTILLKASQVFEFFSRICLPGMNHVCLSFTSLGGSALSHSPRNLAIIFYVVDSIVMGRQSLMHHLFAFLGSSLRTPSLNCG